MPSICPFLGFVCSKNSKPRKSEAWHAGADGPTPGKWCGKLKEKATNQACQCPFLVKEKDKAREDSIRVDVGRKRIDEIEAILGGLGKVESLVKAVGEVQNRIH